MASIELCCTKRLKPVTIKREVTDLKKNQLNQADWRSHFSAVSISENWKFLSHLYPKPPHSVPLGLETVDQQ